MVNSAGRMLCGVMIDGSVWLMPADTTKDHCHHGRTGIIGRIVWCVDAGPITGRIVPVVVYVAGRTLHNGDA